MISAMIKSGKLIQLFNKHLFFSLIAFFSFFFLTSTVHAQTLPLSSLEETPVNLQQLSPYSPQIASLAIYNFSHAVSCILSGASPIAPCLEFKFSKNIQGVTSSAPYLSSINTSHGLLGMAASTIDSLYVYRPLNKSEYLTDLGRNIGLIKSANAQVVGSGNAVLSPVFKLWEVTRNIAYLAMIIIFIVVGLMVMFRQKLNPQTVVSIQLALPGLVIGLIMITFSYFLAALITDIAFLGTDIVGYYFSTASQISSPTSLTQELGEKNALSLGGSFIGVVSQSQLKEASSQLLQSLPDAYNPDYASDWWTWLTSPDHWLNTFANPGRLVKMMSAFAGFMFGNTFGSMIGGFAGGISGFAWFSRWASNLTGFQAAAGPVLGGVVASYALVDTPGFLGFAFYFVAVFAILYTLLRLVMALVNNYLQIIFLTITAPFHFLISSLPGRQDVAINWMRNMLCHVLAFPAVIAVFYFAAFMLGTKHIPGLTVGSAPQLASTSTLPLFGGLDLSLVQSLLAFGAILATPKIPEIICRAIGKPGQAGGMVDQTIVAGVGSGQKYSGQYGAGYGQVGGQLGQAWTKWKGQDPYGSLSEKYWARAGYTREDVAHMGGVKGAVSKGLLPYDKSEDLQRIAAENQSRRLREEAVKKIDTRNWFRRNIPGFRRPEPVPSHADAPGGETRAVAQGAEHPDAGLLDDF